MNKILLISIIYICFILFNIDNNSNIEIFFKAIILMSIMIFFNYKESKKIFFIFYVLFFISCILFFIFYLLSNSESDRYFANFLFIISMGIFPMYGITSFNFLFRNYIDFLKYNSIFLLAIILFLIKDFLGLESGITNMSYTKFDLMIFGLIIIQMIFSFYFLKIRKVNE